LSTSQKKSSEQAKTKLIETLDAVHVDTNAVDLAALVDNEAVDLQVSSDESETSSQLNAKYEANVRALNCPLCN
jgi:hypothetical protein